MRRRFLRVAPLKTLTLLTQPVPPVAPATGGAGTPSNKPVYVPKCEAVLRGNQFTAILTDGLFPGDGLPKQIRQLFDDLPLHGIKGVVEFFGFEASLMFRERGLAEGFELLQQTTAIGLESAPAPADGTGLTLLFRGKAKESPVFHEEAAASARSALQSAARSTINVEAARLSHGETAARRDKPMSTALRLLAVRTVLLTRLSHKGVGCETG